jgi:hypothetical protein
MMLSKEKSFASAENRNPTPVSLTSVNEFQFGLNSDSSNGHLT